MTGHTWKVEDALGAQDAAAVEERKREREWLDRCVEGDERAIRWILDHYRERVVRLASRVLHNSREAEDVAQEAFVKAFRQIDQFRGESGFYAWLYRIVINLCLDKMRRKSASCEILLEEYPLAQQTAAAPDMDNRLWMEQILNTLTPAMRAALVLREVEGLEYAEIASVLNIPVGTVRSRLNAAREQFRKQYAAMMQEVDHV